MKPFLNSEMFGGLLTLYWFYCKSYRERLNIYIINILKKNSGFKVLCHLNSIINGTGNFQPEEVSATIATKF